MFQHISIAGEKKWKPDTHPGVEVLVLHTNEENQGVTILRKFHAGTMVPAHIHPKADESNYILSGEWEEEGVVYTAGAMFFSPRGELHGPHLARTEVISLTTYDGPLTEV